MDVKCLIEKVEELKKLIESGKVPPEQALRIAVELKKIRERIEGESDFESDCRYACVILTHFLGKEFVSWLASCADSQELSELLFNASVKLSEETPRKVPEKEQGVEVIQKTT
jgi:hypothetical protein